MTKLLQRIEKVAETSPPDYALRKVLEMVRDFEAYTERGTYRINGREWGENDISPGMRQIFENLYGSRDGADRVNA